MNYSHYDEDVANLQEWSMAEKLYVSILRKVQLMHQQQHVISFHVAPELQCAMQMHLSRNRVTDLAGVFPADDMAPGVHVRVVAGHFETAAVVAADMMKLAIFEAVRRLFQSLA